MLTIRVHGGDGTLYPAVVGVNLPPTSPEVQPRIPAVERETLALPPRWAYPPTNHPHGTFIHPTWGLTRVSHGRVLLYDSDAKSLIDAGALTSGVNLLYDDGTNTVTLRANVAATVPVSDTRALLTQLPAGTDPTLWEWVLVGQRHQWGSVVLNRSGSSAPATWGDLLSGLIFDATGQTISPTTINALVPGFAAPTVDWAWDALKGRSASAVADAVAVMLGLRILVDLLGVVSVQNATTANPTAYLNLVSPDRSLGGLSERPPAATIAFTSASGVSNVSTGIGSGTLGVAVTYTDGGSRSAFVSGYVIWEGYTTADMTVAGFVSAPTSSAIDCYVLEHDDGTTRLWTAPGNYPLPTNGPVVSSGGGPTGPDTVGFWAVLTAKTGSFYSAVEVSGPNAPLEIKTGGRTTDRAVEVGGRECRLNIDTPPGSPVWLVGPYTTDKTGASVADYYEFELDQYAGTLVLDLAGSTRRFPGFLGHLPQAVTGAKHLYDDLGPASGNPVSGMFGWSVSTLPSTQRPLPGYSLVGGVQGNMGIAGGSAVSGYTRVLDISSSGGSDSDKARALLRVFDPNPQGSSAGVPVTGLDLLEYSGGAGFLVGAGVGAAASVNTGGFSFNRRASADPFGAQCSGGLTGGASAGTTTSGVSGSTGLGYGVSAAYGMSAQSQPGGSSASFGIGAGSASLNGGVDSVSGAVFLSLGGFTASGIPTFVRCVPRQYAPNGVGGTGGLEANGRFNATWVNSGTDLNANGNPVGGSGYDVLRGATQYQGIDDLFVVSGLRKVFVGGVHVASIRDGYISPVVPPPPPGPISPPVVPPVPPPPVGKGQVIIYVFDLASRKPLVGRTVGVPGLGYGTTGTDGSFVLSSVNAGSYTSELALNNLYETAVSSASWSGGSSSGTQFITWTAVYGAWTSVAYYVSTTSGPLDVKAAQSSNNTLAYTGGHTLVPVDTSGGSFTQTLPATWKNGDTVTIRDVGNALSTNPLTVSGGTQTIDGAASYTFRDSGGAVSFCYVNTEWKLVWSSYKVSPQAAPVTAASLVPGTFHNYALPAGFAGRTVYLFSNGGPSTITGISAAGAVDGTRVRVVMTSTSGTVTFNNQDAASTAANRIVTYSGAPVSYPANCGFELEYDASISRWRIPLQDLNSGGGGGSVQVKTATLTLPNNTLDHEQTITDASVSATNRLIIQIAPHDNADENGPEALDVIGLVAKAGSGQFTVTLALRTPASGDIKVQYLIGTP